MLALLNPGCAREAPFSSDQNIAARQVNQLLPKGTSETRAKKALADRGFKISRLSSDHAVNHLLVCSYSDNDAFWQVGLIVINDKVAATSVTVTPTHAPPR